MQLRCVMPRFVHVLFCMNSRFVRSFRHDQEARVTLLHKRPKQHKGSIYCIAWNATGDLLATGSNDKTIKLMRFDANTCNLEGRFVAVNYKILSVSACVKKLKIKFRNNINYPNNKISVIYKRSSFFLVPDAAPPMTFHGGTVRDMCFMEDTSNNSNILISGGAGDNKIYVTDCETAMPFQALTGHTGELALFFQE